MQDLTVAGFRLWALEQAAPDDLRPEIGALAVWLSERQAALRDFVSALIDADADRMGDGLRAEVEALLPGCRIAWETDPQIIAASSFHAAALMRLAAAIASGAQQAVRIAVSTDEHLSLRHDGPPLGASPQASTAVRRAIRELDARLQMVRRGDVETLTVLPGSHR
jgi:hypothetical protein